MLDHASVVAVTCLALEARIARGPGVSVLCNHSRQLGASLKAAIVRGATGIISFGIAGGLTPDLAAGDCIVASGVRSGDEVIATDDAWAQSLLEAIPNATHAEIVGTDTLVMDPQEKRRVHARTGAMAVDMESHIAARIAFAHRIPFAACRIIIDAAHRTLPPAAAVGLRQNGTPDVLAVVRSLLHTPSQIPDLIRAARDAWIARHALRVARERMGVRLGFPCHDRLEFDRAPVVAQSCDSSDVRAARDRILIATQQ
jgi:hopanoid-associated phosphorylase